MPPSPVAGAQRSGGSSAGAMLFPSPVCSARSCGVALQPTSLASRRATLSPQAATAAGHPSRPRPHPRWCLLRCRHPLPQYGRRRQPRRPCVVASSSALSAALLGTSPCPWRVASSSPLRPDLVRPHPLLLYSMTAPPVPASLRVLLRAGDWLMRQRALPRPLQGRPKGVTPKYSLKPLVPHLSELLGVNVVMANDCIGDQEVQKLASSLPDGGVLLLENVRFYKEEEKNDPEFSKKLTSVADLYVNDAFGTAHRAHASTEGVTKYLKPAVAGFLMQKELDYLVGAVANPKKPFAAIVGGSKVSTKIGVIESLLAKVDILMDML
ncbi:unnamed protein product [Miscanthus lutarioriparius]|uniref:Phosphoglycerate kinase n=1 Tax=Miscanthus lutarioriparius TaxID=422564 RepID=A0A811R9V1_9POAL|nr:unnamed protein product [Miscanthus lutarioriparius]